MLLLEPFKGVLGMSSFAEEKKEEGGFEPNFPDILKIWKLQKYVHCALKLPVCAALKSR